jgi:large subunit ribosomal protein L4
MSKIPLKSIKGDSVGEYEVADNLLVLDRGEQAVHEAVVAYGAHQRAGTASTKSKANVSGTGAKPWKQKGLGRARAGYKQSPIWRGGAVAHGPHPRKYTKKVSKKVIKLAFQRGFSAKLDQGDITVIENLDIATPKTKEISSVLKNLGMDRGALFIVDSGSDNVVLAARNIPKVEVATAALVNTYQILRYKNVVVTKAGMEALEKRLA